ncbi:MAG: hypothetical protein ACJ76F_14555 [Bacteroidia bacterium]
MHKFFLRVLIILTTVTVVVACKNSSGKPKIKEFRVFTNLPGSAGNDSLISMTADLSNAVLYGIQFPTKDQTKNGYFDFSFSITNTSDKDQRYYYKIYYQNESYKFPDDHILSGENFYGSWDDVTMSFKPTLLLKPNQQINIMDSFRVMGNPRNEAACYGSDPENFIFTKDLVELKKQQIKGTPEWMEKIRKKAVEKKISTEEQVYLDAVWLIGNERMQDKSANNRWKRNPRMGKYKIMLVVTTGEDYSKIPAGVKNIDRTDSDGKFINPFGYFAGAGGALSKTEVITADKMLEVHTHFDLTSGVYVDPMNVNKSNYSKSDFNSSCGDSNSLYHKAQFGQYFHYINTAFVLHNIPEIRDVTGENYTRAEYALNEKKYTESPELINGFVKSTDCPCQTVKVDSLKNAITLINPKSDEATLKKEHVGVYSRIGFTYGKFRTKVKFPKMLSRDNVWNGLTNAFWLLYQGEGEWNKRRICDNEFAYIEKYEPDEQQSLFKSKKSICYSEIDIEILKESQFWPKTSYKKIPFQEEDASKNRDIMVTCTNWDMACHEPKQFHMGAQEFEIDNKSYVFHRWNDFNKSITAKIPADHDELFARDYYYFEIEWQPEKIIWRLGPEKDKMKVICVMDNTITAIPNNQMMIIFTQEWHNQEWWPTAPFKQNFVPYPKKDIVGQILEMEIN